jgi:ribonuclease P protein component
MRTGRKTVSDSMVTYLKNDSNPLDPKFGFVVSKTVGSAVERNLVKRRLRSAIRDRMAQFQSGQTLVIRALPSIKELSWDELGAQLDWCLKQTSTKSDSLTR